MGVNTLAFTGHEQCEHTPQGSLPLTAFGGERGMKMLILGATAHIIGLLFSSYILLGIFVELILLFFSHDSILPQLPMRPIGIGGHAPIPSGGK